MTSPVFERFLSTEAALAAFDAKAIVQGMLDFEAALARAQVAEGLIPANAAKAIAASCRSLDYDLDAIVAASASAGTLAIPLVRQLTMAVRARDAESAGFVHWGSTSQDVIDTAMVLATRHALDLIDARLGDLTASLLRLAESHRDLPLLARTLMQPAQVIGFGFKLVAWIAPLVRGRARVRDAARAALQLQFGGAVGTLTILGDRAGAVGRRVADELGLPLPPGAWHTQRDDWVALGCAVGVVCGSLGKIAVDISLLAQGEIGEVAEPSVGADGQRRGGSSAMPHKRNPVAAMTALAASLRAPQRVAALLAAMPQQHERGLGNWQAELAEWPGLFISAHGAVHALADAAAGLSIDGQRMRANIDALHGLVFAEAAAALLARQIGKSRAHALCEQLSAEAVAAARPLRELMLAAVEGDAELRGHVAPSEIDAVFDIDAAARRAGVVAEPQLDALRRQHASLQIDAPFHTTITSAP